MGLAGSCHDSAGATGGSCFGQELQTKGQEEMKTATLKINQDLHGKLKAKAKKEGRVLQKMVESTLGESLEQYQLVRKLLDLPPEQRKGFIDFFNGHPQFLEDPPCAPDHNPDGLTSEQYGAPEWRLLKKNESVSAGDQFRASGRRWVSLGQDCGTAILPPRTYRRRV